MSQTSSTDFLHMLTPKQRLRLSMDCPQHTLRRGGYLFMPGDPCNGVFIVMSGRVKLSRVQESGRELALGMVEPGEIFGLECFQGVSERESSAQAMEDSRVMLISRDRLQALLAEKFPAP